MAAVADTDTGLLPRLLPVTVYVWAAETAPCVATKPVSVVGLAESDAATLGKTAVTVKSSMPRPWSLPTSFKSVQRNRIC